MYFARDGDLHSHLWLPVEGGKVTDLDPKHQTSAWVESLPLAHALRGLDVGLALQRVGSLPLMDTPGVQGWRWWAQNALKLATVLLLLLVPHAIASFMTTRLGYVRPLPNLVVSLVGLLLCVSAFYVYFLFLSLHGLHEDHIVLALPLLFVPAFSQKIVTGRVAYHRCTECHAMFSANDQGSAVVGQAHVTTKHSKYTSRGKREGFKSTTQL